MKKFLLFLLIFCFIVGVAFMVPSCVKEVDENGRVIDDQEKSVLLEQEDAATGDGVVEIEIIKEVVEMPVAKKKLKRKIFKVTYDESKGVPGWYRVQLGDTLPDISRRVYGTALWAEEICRDNGIEYCGPLEVGKLIKIYPREG